MLLALLIQASVATAPVPTEQAKEPFAALKGVVVDAIRDCGVPADGSIRVCARDRGFAEGWRSPKLEKPKPIDDGGGIKIDMKVTNDLAPPGS